MRTMSTAAAAGPRRQSDRSESTPSVATAILTTHKKDAIRCVMRFGVKKKSAISAGTGIAGSPALSDTSSRPPGPEK